ncbi:MAG: hypothetical protein JSR17_06415 [Proteobacteria bacterium]|nr:hypothetical protein [Pseudomonadota bacterium]
MLKSFEQQTGRKAQRTAQNQEPLSYEQRFLQLLNEDPEAAFNLALEKEDEQRCKQAQEKGANIEALYRGWNRLHDAVAKGELSKVQLLCRLGANVNAQSTDKDTPMLIATFYKKFEVAEFLATLPGVDPNIANKYKKTAFKEALKSNDFRFFVLMLKLPCDIQPCLEMLNYYISYDHRAYVLDMLKVDAWTKLLKDNVRQELLAHAIERRCDLAIIKTLFLLQNIPFGVEFSTLLSEQGKAHFDSVAKIKEFLALKEPLSYLEMHQLCSPIVLAALRLIQMKISVKEMYAKQHEEEVEQHGEEEDAMAEKMVKLANKHYQQTVEPYVREKFLSFNRKGDRKKALLAVEKKIREFILEEIRKKAQEGDQQDILSFIAKNKKGLINGTQKAMKASALIFKGLTDEQAAWRSYNPYAEVDSYNWQNLFTECNEQKVYTTSAATGDHTLSGQEASTTVRERAAHYFLALTEGEDKAAIADRMAIFILKLAEIRNTKGVDIPSCYPGTITRIAQMGAAHDVLRLPPTFEQVLLQTMQAKVLKLFKEHCEKLPTVKEKQDFLNALIDLTEHSAKEIVQDPARYPQEWLPMRQQFIDALGNEVSIFEAVKKEVEWEVEDPEMILVSQHLVDVARVEIGITLAKELDKMLDSVPTVEEKARANPFNEDNPRERELTQLLLSSIEPRLPFYFQSLRKLMGLTEYLKFKVPVLLQSNIDDAQIAHFFENLEGEEYAKETAKQRFVAQCLSQGLKTQERQVNNPYITRISTLQRQIATTPHPGLLVQLHKALGAAEAKRDIFITYYEKLKPCFNHDVNADDIAKLVAAIADQYHQKQKVDIKELEEELADEGAALLHTEAVQAVLAAQIKPRSAACK